MADFIFELLSEEVPARMQVPMLTQIETSLKQSLEKENLFFSHIESFVTPRRMILIVEGLSLTQEDASTERKGPKVGAPDQAINGFVGSAGITRDELTVKSTPKGDFYFAISHSKGRPTKDVIKTTMETILNSITWPKSMRWGAYNTRWVRPIKNIMAVFGGETLPITFGHITANNLSQGHRFLSEGEFKVETPKAYKAELTKRFVFFDHTKRKEFILKQAEKLAAEKNLTLVYDNNLLDEVTGLVEWPNMLLGDIDQQFMSVPEEALISSIRAHQKYFCLRSSNKKLAPHFIVASNMTSDDEGEEIRSGNERVLRARLADAKFFWDQDRKIPLIDRSENLKKIIFHAKLGTIANKTKRVTALAKFLAVWVPHAKLEHVERAAQLCKADLTTEMVGEFPDLQGIMGEYYAKANGEHNDVALAISQHYAPLGPSDSCPTAPVSIAISLADKIDTLVGLFAVNEKPTGSKDPFALRRAALGVIRIILENNLSFNMNIALNQALKGYPASILKTLDENAKPSRLPIKKGTKIKPNDVIDTLLDFLSDRLKALLKSENVRHDLITAVFNDGSEDNILHLVQRVAALDSLLETEDGINLLAAYRRANNIVHIEEKKDERSYTGTPSKNAMEAEEEIALYTALSEIKPKIQQALKENDYKLAMSLISQLRTPIDSFFDKVTVNCDDNELRKNRLKLLAQMRDLLHEIANFSYIEG